MSYADGPTVGLDYRIRHITPKPLLPSLLILYSALPILKTFVLQTEHVPLVAGLPFFMVTACGLVTSRRSRHFMQYASINFPLESRFSHLGTNRASRTPIRPRRSVAYRIFCTLRIPGRVRLSPAHLFIRVDTLIFTGRYQIPCKNYGH